MSTSVFSNVLNEVEKSNKQISSNKDEYTELSRKQKQEITDNLVKDVISLFKTGLTVEELDMIQKLLDSIKNKIAESKPPLNADETNELNSIITRLELMIEELQKRAKFGAIGNMEKFDTNDFHNKNNLDTNKSLSLDIFEKFNNRIENAQNSIDELNKRITRGQINEVKNSNHEELELLQALKFQ